MSFESYLVKRDTTLQQIASERGIIVDEKFTLDNFLLYDGNNVRIKEGYFADPSRPISSYVVERGTVIHYPSLRVAKNALEASANQQGNFYDGAELAAFYSKGFADLVRDDRYKRVARGATLAPESVSSYTKVKNDCNVLLWCRSLGADGSEGRLLNVTPFVSVVNAEESLGGATFSVNLSSPAYTYNESEGYVFDRDQVLTVDHQGAGSFYSRQSLRNHGHATSPDFTIPFFQLVVSRNDVVFIQFEPLALEYEKPSLRARLDKVYNRRQTIDSLWVDPAEIVGATWDMIALVDEVAGMVDPAGATIVTNVSGRDLVKLPQDDSTYYFAADVALGTNGFGGQRADVVSLNGLRNVRGEIDLLQTRTNQSVGWWLGFIFNHLSTIEIFNEGPFSAYPKDVNEPGVIRRVSEVEDEATFKIMSDSFTSYDPEDETSSAPTVRRLVTTAPGIWSAVRVMVDPALKDRHIVDYSFATARGPLESLVEKVCQRPFVEFYGQTWGDKYYFIARQPPTNKKAVESYIERGLVVDIEPDSHEQFEFAFAESECMNWYYVEQRSASMKAAGTDDLLAFLPSGFIERQARRYGIKVLHEVSNYVDRRYFGGDASVGNVNKFRKQAGADLRYLVESQAHIPYTRRGTVICDGDRRIRAGTFIRFKATGEIGYVTSTSNVFNDTKGSSTRATIVNVERLMVEEHLDKYFEIAKVVETTKETVNPETKEKGTEISFKVEVNDDIIDFFEKKRQFLKPRN